MPVSENIHVSGQISRVPNPPTNGKAATLPMPPVTRLRESGWGGDSNFLDQMPAPLWTLMKQSVSYSAAFGWEFNDYGPDDTGIRK